jgi:hypothetical protein
MSINTKTLSAFAIILTTAFGTISDAYDITVNGAGATIQQHGSTTLIYQQQGECIQAIQYLGLSGTMRQFTACPLAAGTVPNRILTQDEMAAMAHEYTMAAVAHVKENLPTTNLPTTMTSKEKEDFDKAYPCSNKAIIYPELSESQFMELHKELNDKGIPHEWQRDSWKSFRSGNSVYQICTDYNNANSVRKSMPDRLLTSGKSPEMFYTKGVPESALESFLKRSQKDGCQTNYYKEKNNTYTVRCFIRL